MSTFFRVVETPASHKGAKLSSLIRELNAGKVTAGIHRRGVDAFRKVPGSPFAYWVSQSLVELFSKLPPLEAEDRTIRVGLQTSDDFRFVRTHWETDPSRAHAVWVPIVKGGASAFLYADVPACCNWRSRGAELKAFAETTPGTKHWSRNIRNVEFYFQAGATWPLRGIHFSTVIVPAGGLFSIGGKMAFAPPEALLAVAAIMNSVAFDYLLCLSAGKVGGVQYEVGLVQKTPVPNFGGTSVARLKDLARRAWSLKRLLDTTNETSHAFVLPPGTLGYEASPLHPDAGGFNRADIHRELAELQAEIDDKVFDLYGISDEDRAIIEASMSGGASSASATESEEDGSSDEDEDSDDGDSESSVELTATTLTTYSWLVGVAFGRFDPRLATRKRPIPPEPEPFDPLPARSPGMWPEGEEPDTVPPDIMVDDPGHDHDIRMLVANAAAMTGWPDPDDLRQWLAKEFFPLHIKMYSKSRRKAPIYWQLATPSATYSVWLYIHAFTKDALFRVQNDYVAPKLAHEQRKLESLQAASQDGQTAADRKELATQESLVEELRAFLDEVKRVAPLWNPNLDDGVIINFSLLWRLVPQHKPWQKELKSTWDALCAGRYDWSHLAMHLWPDRVVPQCAKDRSLAIAHGLEEAFWVEGSDGRWTPRKTPTAPISELIQERTSPAVQDALKRLLSAPAAGAGGPKAKRGKKGAR